MMQIDCILKKPHTGFSQILLSTSRLRNRSTRPLHTITHKIGPLPCAESTVWRGPGTLCSPHGSCRGWLVGLG